MPLYDLQFTTYNLRRIEAAKMKLLRPLAG